MPLSVDSTQLAEPSPLCLRPFASSVPVPCQRSSGTVCVHFGLHRARELGKHRAAAESHTAPELSAGPHPDHAAHLCPATPAHPLLPCTNARAARGEKTTLYSALYNVFPTPLKAFLFF